MVSQIFDFLHSTGPAPAYAIESDSEDDQWADEPSQEGVEQRGTKPSEEPQKEEKEEGELSELEWKPAAPAPLQFPGRSGLLVLIGDAGLLVGSGLPLDLRSPSQPFIQLDQFLLLAPSAPFALSPRHVPLHLQSPLALKLLSDIRPPNLTIISTYQAPTYIPPSDLLPLRYLASSPSESAPLSLENLGCKHFQVPNLIKGFEAALMIQANILQIESKIILMPAISIPHEDKSSTSIPAGQYDFAGGMATGIGEGAGLPPSLLGLDDPALRRTLGAVIDHSFLAHLPSPSHWQFPPTVDPALKLSLRKKLNLDALLKPISQPSAASHKRHQLGLMYA